VRPGARPRPADAAAVISVHAGSTPLVISMPHVGREIPAEIAARMTPRARAVPDTDWHVERLYAFARERGAAWLEPRLSRYVIDLNRPPDDAALYPGQVSTGLCPRESFDGEPLYAGAEPSAAEVAARRRDYWQPYHDALAALVEAARARHGYAVLLDAHSIRSQVPRLFAGRLPDVNLGTNDGRACEPRLAAALVAVVAARQTFSHVLDGRFKGGYITRHYGRPAAAVHALQIELAQSAYMDESTADYEVARAAPLVRLLADVVAALLAFRPE
jgi:N-formylglutamate deformylase